MARYTPKETDFSPPKKKKAPQSLVHNFTTQNAKQLWRKCFPTHFSSFKWKLLQHFPPKKQSGWEASSVAWYSRYVIRFDHRPRHIATATIMTFHNLYWLVNKDPEIECAKLSWHIQLGSIVLYIKQQGFNECSKDLTILTLEGLKHTDLTCKYLQILRNNANNRDNARVTMILPLSLYS